MFNGSRLGSSLGRGAIASTRRNQEYLALGARLSEGVTDARNLQSCWSTSNLQVVRIRIAKRIADHLVCCRHAVPLVACILNGTLKGDSSGIVRRGGEELDCLRLYVDADIATARAIKRLRETGTQWIDMHDDVAHSAEALYNYKLFTATKDHIDMGNYSHAYVQIYIRTYADGVLHEAAARRNSQRRSEAAGQHEASMPFLKNAKQLFIALEKIVTRIEACPHTTGVP
ncbi:hypothetical protein EDB83DRAFT_2325146 [Lactarius deliciosus]|nr:hypothetical protein EDB83DRAFT_2325146 [Lactarius deliciosus]